MEQSQKYTIQTPLEEIRRLLIADGMQQKGDNEVSEFGVKSRLLEICD